MIIRIICIVGSDPGASTVRQNRPVSETPSDYDDSMLELLQLLWGEGFLSPGGPEAVREICAPVPLAGARVLDSGCGLGGLDQVLVGLGAAHVTAVDVAPHLIDLGRARIEAAGLTDRIALTAIEPEAPLPFDDGAFDVVFTKDAWLHVIDKPALLAEVHRVLRPGGWLAAGDWLRADRPESTEWTYFVELEGIPYRNATAPQYLAMLPAAGFTDVRLDDFNAWYLALAGDEYAKLQGPFFDVLTERLGIAARDHFIEDWRMLCRVLESGELRPSRFWARKP